MTKNALVIVVLALSFVCLVASGASAQLDAKIGYIDSQRIFAEYKQTQDAERIYKQEVDGWKAQAQTMERDIAKFQDELRAQSLMLSEEKLREKKLEHDQKLEEYNRFMADTFGDTGIAAKRNQELTQPIVEKINRILENMAQTEGLELVFDIANANIVYAKKEYDLTDRVLEELNKQ